MHTYGHHGKRTLQVSWKHPAFEEQVRRWLHGDRQGRGVSAHPEASRGLCGADVPGQRPEGETPQHTAVSAPIHTGRFSSYLQPVHHPPAEAQRRGLLCVPDHSGPGLCKFRQAPAQRVVPGVRQRRGYVRRAADGGCEDPPRRREGVTHEPPSNTQDTGPETQLKQTEREGFAPSQYRDSSPEMNEAQTSMCRG